MAQNELLGDLAAQVAAAQSPGWREVTIEYRHLGRKTDASVGALDPNGGYQLWDPPAEVWRMLQRLRGGMYRDGEGTWFSMRVKVQPPARFTVQYNWQNPPGFPEAPGRDDFVLELERFPRGAAYQPAWFRAALA